MSREREINKPMDSNQIIASSQDITLTGATDDKTKFCAAWPNVKAGLTLLQNIIKNPIAKGAIGIVIAAGDAISKEICG
jgi:hypothetical protein